MACPGSVRLSLGMPNESSAYAAEGTAAHALGEHCLKHGHAADRLLGQWIWLRGGEHGVLCAENPHNDVAVGDFVFPVDDDMSDAVQVYLDTVRQAYLPGDVLAIEQRFDLSAVYPGLFGTNDASIYRPGTGELLVFDYKHGRGVPVEPESNPQLLYYALGAVTSEDGRALTTVTVTIVQPRCPHPNGPVRSWSVDAMDLIEWSADLVAAAKATEAPDAPLVPGGLQCRFCQASPICPALRSKVHETAMADFAEDGTPVLSEPNTFGPDSLASLLAEVELIEGWCQRVREFAHHEAEAGRTPTGYKLVPTRPQRKFKNEEETLAFLKEKGVENNDLYSDPKVKSVAQTEAALKKYGYKPKDAKALIAHLVESVSNGSVLAPLDDPRKAVKPEAVKDFE